MPCDPPAKQCAKVACVLLACVMTAASESRVVWLPSTLTQPLGMLMML